MSENKTQCFTLVTGNTLGFHKDLMNQIPDLREVNTEAECDIILVFCPVVRIPELDIKAAVEELHHISDTKPAVLVALHHTFDPARNVGDSSRSVNRKNTLTVDCLFYEDKGLLQCQKNDESLAKIINYIEMQSNHESPNQKLKKRKQPGVDGDGSKGITDQHRGAEKSHGKAAGREPEKAQLKYFILLAGQTLDAHEEFMRRLKHQFPQLQEVNKVEECDVILVFCPIVSRAGTDIQAAMKSLNHHSGAKPAVLVVLHRTFNAECFVPDSSKAVKREKTITVDCLFHENQGFLHCQKNDEAFNRIINSIKPQVRPVNSMQVSVQPKKAQLKYFILLAGRTLDAHEEFMRRLKHQFPQLQEVDKVEKCDVILVFCPIVSRAGTDIQAALKSLNQHSDNKPAVLVVLHHTFNPECFVPDSSRAVKREKTITVDCLFHENQGFLQCQKNDESFTKIVNYIKPQIGQIMPGEDDMDTEQPPIQSNKATLNFFILQTGPTQNAHENFVGHLKCQIPELQKVDEVEECDFILVFCTDVSQAENDIETTRHLSDTKPAVLVVLHHTSDPDFAVPDSSRAVKREKTIAVDCLCHERIGLLQCQKNLEALMRVKNSQRSLIDPTMSEKNRMDTKQPPMQSIKATLKYFILPTGQTLNAHDNFVGQLKDQIPELQKVDDVEECDFILGFCPDVSQAENYIEKALKHHHLSDAKPVVLVVLQHTFDPECGVPDSSRTVTVYYLFYENQGSLQCQQKHGSFTRVINYIKPQIDQIMSGEDRVDTERMQLKKAIINLPSGQTRNAYYNFVGRLKDQIPELQKVDEVEECDFILVFCPVMSQDENYIETTVKTLNHLSDFKPAVLVVLHHTFDPDCNVPDSSKAVNREKNITVDCLFLENLNLLRCQTNLELFARVKSYIKPVIDSVSPIEDRKDTMQYTVKTHKYFTFKSEISQKDLMKTFTEIFDLKEVQTEDECDLSLTFNSALKNDKEEEAKQEDATEKQGNREKKPSQSTQC